MGMIRASSVPRLIQCPASRLGDTPVRIGGDYATLGTCAHLVMSRSLEAGETKAQVSPALAEDFDVDIGDLARLANTAMRTWRERLSGQIKVLALEERMQAALTEGKDGVILSGHADLIGVRDQTPVILDWKFGWVERDYRAQLKAYALLLYLYLAAGRLKIEGLDGLPEVVKGVIVWGQSGASDVYDFSQEDLAAFHGELLDALESEEFGPGDHCDYCPRHFDCPVRASMLHGTSLVIQGKEMPLTAESVAALYPQARALEKCLADFFSQTKTVIEQAGGSIPMGDGRVLALQEGQKDTVSLTPEAVPVLCSALGLQGETALLARLRPTLNKSDIIDAVSDAAPRGQKGKAKDDIMQALAEAGAVKTSRFKRLVAKKEKEGGE